MTGEETSGSKYASGCLVMFMGGETPFVVELWMLETFLWVSSVLVNRLSVTVFITGLLTVWVGPERFGGVDEEKME